ncbi:low molecular weight phosphatase family protein [Luedemannella helvata]|uniref:Phosphotyrosine protein phosphatase I domain-containing protein n=1 Tax=Luedemannella helvata TaxID=349315 RepID=A0ABN2L342_9ACTN
MRVLFVCHANLCRSPMAERLLRLAVDTRPGLADAGVTAASAGTHARPRHDMHPLAADVLREFGADPDGFASQPVHAGLLCEADLVLTAARAQRATCVTLAPAVLGRTFTLRQFARLAAAVDADQVRTAGPARRVAAIVGGVHEARAHAQPVPPDEDDVPDPVGGGPEEMQACAALIQAALHPLLVLLTGGSR